MFRIGIIEGSDNPEQSRSSETEKKPDVPSESDKQKLECLENKPNDYHWDGKPTHNTDWDEPASPATKTKELRRW